MKALFCGVIFKQWQSLIGPPFTGRHFHNTRHKDQRAEAVLWLVEQLNGQFFDRVAFREADKCKI